MKRFVIQHALLLIIILTLINDKDVSRAIDICKTQTSNLQAMKALILCDDIPAKNKPNDHKYPRAQSMYMYKDEQPFTVFKLLLSLYTKQSKT